MPNNLSEDERGDLAKDIRELHQYEQLVWEPNTRRGKYLISNPLTKEQAEVCLSQIRENEDEVNKDCYRVSQLVNDPTKFVVVAELVKLEPEKILEKSRDKQVKKMQMIADFLNEYHAPLGEKNWEVSNPPYIKAYYAGPPLGSYLAITPEDKKLVEQGHKVQKAMLEEFSLKAKRVGFTTDFVEKFKHALFIDDGKSKCTYSFKGDFIEELYQLAVQTSKKTKSYIATTTARTFLAQKNLPHDPGTIIASHLTLKDVAALARTDKTAAGIAKKTKEEVFPEEKENKPAGPKTKL